jgi:predicted enzyme related to lactoylglutathione lyase
VFYVTLPGPGDDLIEARFIDALQQARVQHVVKLSVWNAQDESYLYARAHRASERRLESSGIAYTFLRPSGFMQNLPSNLGASIKQQGAFALPMAQAAVGHIDARDIAAVAAKILREGGHEGQGYNLSGPEALTYAQVADTLSALLGKKVTYHAVTPAAWKSTMLGYGVPESMVDGLIDLYQYYVNGGSSTVSNAVASILGRPPTSLEQYLGEQVAAFGGGPRPALPPQGSIVWHELKSPDPSASSDFYGALLGWRSMHIGNGPVGPIWLLQRENDQIGTMVKLAGAGTAHWIPFFAVDNVDEQAAHAVTLGAKVLVPPVTVPRGRAAVIADPQGAAVALFQTIPG